MTEKRFVKGYHTIRDIKENKTHDFHVNIICGLLNELNDENEQLKESYKEFEDECQSLFNAMNSKQNDLYRKNFKLREENERLKSEINMLKTTIGRNEAYIQRIKYGGELR